MGCTGFLYDPPDGLLHKRRGISLTLRLLARGRALNRKHYDSPGLNDIATQTVAKSAAPTLIPVRACSG